jgi:hypothetical protein
MRKPTNQTPAELNLCYLSLVVLLLSATMASSTTDLYWLCFLGEEGATIMQIDVTGNITQPPKSVVLPSAFDGFIPAMALSEGAGDSLNLWYTGAPTVGPDGEDDAFIFRAIVKKKGLERLSNEKTDLKTTNIFHLQTTQKPQDNFLITQANRNGEILLGSEFSQEGILAGTNWELSVERIGEDDCEGAHCGGSVSLDGQVAILIDRETSHLTSLRFQRLSTERKPVGSPKPIEQLDNLHGGIYAADITNSLEGSRRFVIYVWSPESMGSIDPNSLFLQVIDDKTGDKIRDRILIRDFPGAITRGQNIAIDPDGRFVLFADGPLAYQALDKNGYPQGELKILTSTAAGYLNILKDR